MVDAGLHIGLVDGPVLLPCRRIHDVRERLAVHLGQAAEVADRGHHREGALAEERVQIALDVLHLAGGLNDKHIHGLHQ
jgi:hypothetical protein